MANGGIIGPVNIISSGGNLITSVTATGTLTTQPGTKLVQALVIAGGVAANSRLRELAIQRCEKVGIKLRIPSPALCTDNGAMVAALGSLLVSAGRAPAAGAFDADSSMAVTSINLR